MPIRNLDAFFRPSAVAIATAGVDAGLAHVLLRNLFHGDFSRPILPVSPSEPAVEGVLAYRSLSTLPIPADLAVLAMPADALPAAMEQAAAGGARAVLAVSAGIGAPAPTPQRLEALGRTARRLGVRLLGPDSLGLVVPGIGLNASLTPAAVAPGTIALVSASGTVVNAMLDWGAQHGIGFSAVATTGAMAEVGLGDLLDYLALDTATRAIVLYVEDVPDARAFLSAGRAAARNKPVVAFRPGLHDGHDAVWDAAFRRAGMLRVRDLDELFEAAETLALARPPEGDRLFVVSNGGGIGHIATDALAESGARLALPSRRIEELCALAPQGRSDVAPLDLGADADGARYRRAVSLLAEDPAGDAVLVMHAPSALSDGLEVAEAVADTVSKLRRSVLTCWLGETSAMAARHLFAERHLPSYASPAHAVRAFLHVLEYRRNQAALTQTPPSLPEDFAIDPAAARAVTATAVATGRDWLEPEEMRAVLAAFGLAGQDGPVAGITLAVALDEDDRFGPVLRLGRLHQAVALPPLNLHLATEALRQANLAASPDVELTLVKLAQLAVDLPEVAAFHAEPLVIGQGILGLAHCRMRVRPWHADTAARLAIRPYPRQLEMPLDLPDGRRLLVRPVRPEDEPALKGMLDHMTPEAVRLRFFAPLRELSHAVAARLTQLDYDRETAFVVATSGPAGAATIHAIGHLSSDADRLRAEFALMVASDMEGLGLGPMLLRRLLDHAEASGMAEVYGEVLRENKTMLRLCQALGFRQQASPEEPEVLHVSRLMAGAGDRP